MGKFRIIDDLTSDVLFEVEGKDLMEVFENAAEALLSVICQLGKVRPVRAVEVEVKGRDAGELMFNWLQEIIAQVDMEAMFFSRTEILGIGETFLKARLWGEDMEPGKGETVVKAVTNYKFLFEKSGKGYRARASLDI